VPLNEYEFPTNKVSNVQSQLERLVEKNYYLHQSAKDAYRAYLLSYNSHALKEIFNVHRLPLQVCARAPVSRTPPCPAAHTVCAAPQATAQAPACVGGGHGKRAACSMHRPVVR